MCLAAFTVLLLVLLVSNRPSEIARRLRRIVRGARLELAVRRLEGSSAAFDRRYFYFLESARRRLPPGARGVAVRVPNPSEAYRDLAAYQFAPVPALLEPPSVPDGWLLAVFGPERPEGWREISSVAGGALLARGP
ncbi:MAG TPA: hypothetical protein VEG84_00755 [Thermoanaerobaculia bacterium]|nr:hypothetical protein [Thermoanaerobaculia bacterium]